MEHGTPDPGVDLGEGRKLEPPLQSILLPQTAANVLEASPVDPRVSNGKDDAGRLLRTHKPVKGPFAKELVVVLVAAVRKVGEVVGAHVAALARARPAQQAEVQWKSPMGTVWKTGRVTVRKGSMTVARGCKGRGREEEEQGKSHDGEVRCGADRRHGCRGCM